MSAEAQDSQPWWSRRALGRRSCSVAGALLLLALAAPAGAQVGAAPQTPAAPEEPPQSAPDPVALALERAQAPGARRCRPFGRLEVEEAVLVACGRAGLWVLRPQADGAFTVVSTHDLDGAEVVGVFRRSGEIWVELKELSARPLPASAVGAVPAVAPAFPAAAGPDLAPGQGTPPPNLPVYLEDQSAPPADEASPQRAGGEGPPRRLWGAVRRAAANTVVVELGARDGATQGSRIEIIVRDEEQVEEGRVLASYRTLAVGEVVGLAHDWSTVRLGLNEAPEIPAGARGRLVKKRLTRSQVAPPRAGDYWRYSASLRPFLPLGELGIGALLHLSAGFHFDHPWMVQAQLVPAAIGTGKQGAVFANASLIAAGYDGELFGVGLGLGFESVNEPSTLDDPGWGLLVAQLGRLGALDGLHLAMRSDLVLFHQEFEFAGMEGSLQIPLSSGSWLVLAGGGGVAGYGYGEGAIRVLLEGNGGPGSVFIGGGVGGTAVFTRVPGSFMGDFSERVYGGPMLGVSAEYRQ